MSGSVDQKMLTRYIELEKEVQQLEVQGVLKNYDVKRKAADDVAETIKSVEITVKQLEEQTKKEKDDVDRTVKNKSLKEYFKDDVHYQSELNREQEEYLEAKNKEEVAKQQLLDLKNQHAGLTGEAASIKGPADQLKSKYEERDKLLSDIFGGEYGSDLENKLEAMYDTLMDQKQRVSVANYKWTNARILLYHAVNQLSHAVQRWKQIMTVGDDNNLKYLMATEARNNNVAAVQNLEACARYLGTSIEFPYCKPQELQTLTLATQNIYIDMQDANRHQHATMCYDTTWRRASALLQWFDNVIANTIQKDLMKVTEEGRKVEKDLRAERIRLIREKIKESGGDVSTLNEAGLKGLTDGFSHMDQTQMSEEDMDLHGIGVTKPAPLDDGGNLPDAPQMNNDRPAPAPTPLPLSELAKMPTESDLFGDISLLKEQYVKNTEEYLKAQDMNKARVSAGLHDKIEQRKQRRRHKQQA
ncbi:uncharacterized protein LOC128222078 isoform X2 [Mya arenaria]|uniref:uncharacterized protein LOC128222078 isoform X2 n=1 Tax=Mya arenaria TaxID=6604 RepID=UPI0022E0769E|nr:uncharacterized protein LOC128222078 isoform X2 [Mya arenaria]